MWRERETGRERRVVMFELVVISFRRVYAYMFLTSLVWQRMRSECSTCFVHACDLSLVEILRSFSGVRRCSISGLVSTHKRIAHVEHTHTSTRTHTHTRTITSAVHVRQQSCHISIIRQGRVSTFEVGSIVRPGRQPARRVGSVVRRG